MYAFLRWSAEGVQRVCGDVLVNVDVVIWHAMI
jgi:hypothetical protein